MLVVEDGLDFLPALSWFLRIVDFMLQHIFTNRMNNSRRYSKANDKRTFKAKRAHLCERFDFLVEVFF
jgi:hypothetical protein